MRDGTEQERSRNPRDLSRCPDWCVEDCGDDRRGAHLGAAVELRTPGGPDGRPPQTMLTAHVAWLHEDQEEPGGPRPEVWVYCEGGSAELDLNTFDAHIGDMESHVLRLRALRIRYAAMLQGAVLVEEVNPADAHPARTGSGCPFWCDARTYSLTARGKTSHVHTGLARRVSDELWISLNHSPFERLPEVDLTVTAPGRDGTALRLSLTEAEQFREHLSELIASAQTCASRDLLPVDELLSRMGAHVVEDSRLTSGSPGYILRDVTPGGRVRVVVPGGLPRDRTETFVRKLLAEVPIDNSGSRQDGTALFQLADSRPLFVANPESAA
ncbi:DUF6907 domain-containing protein [Streptomyces sp. NPDC002680]|uniref:DUF6907 domain-containing protein n=1 Tax=Streptomyces sp. NPDC002680 TaxID=3364659 RepID=UPI0036AA848B